MKKRVLSVLMALSLMVSLMPMALAADGETEPTEIKDLSALKGVLSTNGSYKLAAGITTDAILNITATDFTLDLNGYTIERSGTADSSTAVYVSGNGKVTITDSSSDGGGTIKATSNGVGLAVAAGTVSLENIAIDGVYTALQATGGTLKLENCTVGNTTNTPQNAMNISGSAQVTLTDTTVTGKDFAAQVGLDESTDATKLDVTGSSKLSATAVTESESGDGIRAKGAATVTVAGTSTVTGSTSGSGIEVYGSASVSVSDTVAISGNEGVTVFGGNFTLDGGSITANGSNRAAIAISGNPGGGEAGASIVTVNTGSVSGSSAVDVLQSAVEGSNNVTVSLKDGTFTGDVNIAEGTAGTATISLAITGGTFYTDPTDYMAEGYGTICDEFTWTVKKLHNVNVADGIVNGTVTVDKETAVEGEGIVATVAPEDGYMVDAFDVKDSEGTSLYWNMYETDQNYYFNMPASDVTVSATFKPIPATYKVTVAATTNGTASVDKTEAAEGDTVTITATPATNYAVDTITVSYETVVEDDSTTEGENTPAAGEEGGEEAAAAAEETTTPEETTTVTVPVDNNTFTMPAADVTVTVTFKQTQSSGGNSGGSSGGGGGGGSSSSKPTTSTTTNPDGSTTTTTTDKNGTKTEVTENTDGSTTTVETKKDGTVTTTEEAVDGTVTTTVEDTEGNVTTTVEDTEGNVTETVEAADGTVTTTVEDTEGNVTETVENTDGSVEVTQTLSDGTTVATVTDADGAITADVSLGSDYEDGAAVTIPASDLPVGAVAIIVHEDGTEEVVSTSVVTEDGLLVPLEEGASLKVVDNSQDFGDVNDSDWHSDAVAFVSSRNIFNGTGAGQFSPNTAMNRAMVAQVLYNLEKNPASGEADFGDMSGDEWYAPAAAWASENGIVKGHEDGSFCGEDPVSREQLAVMLWRYVGEPASSHDIGHFGDADQISDYAKAALAWANENGIINGTSSDSVSPKDDATRAQVAQMMKNFIEWMVK